MGRWTKVWAGVAVAGMLVLAGGCASSAGPTSLLLTEEEMATPPTLRVGDSAPALVAREWVRGGPVGRFEAGRVYVIDFWASWCGPCVAIMPELAELQKRHASDGVMVIAMTAVDGMNPRGAVLKEIAARSKGSDVAFAIDGGEGGSATVRAYLHAVRESGIPTTFVVDQKGRLVWIGHPADVAGVVQSVLGGTWDLAAARDARDRAARESAESRGLVDAWYKAQDQGDEALQLELLRRLTAMSPENVAHSPSFWFQKEKISLLHRMRDDEGARRAFTDGMAEKEFATEPWAIAEFARALKDADVGMADAAAVRAEQLANERAASEPTTEWARFLKEGYASWDAQALQVLGEYWYSRGNAGEAARLMRTAIALDQEFPQAVEARKKLLAQYESEAAK